MVKVGGLDLKVFGCSSLRQLWRYEGNDLDKIPARACLTGLTLLEQSYVKQLATADHLDNQAMRYETLAA